MTNETKEEALNRQKLAVVILLLTLGSAVGQTPEQLEKKYGKPVISYVASEHILITPEYAGDGQICLLRLHPRHYAPNVNYVSANLPFQELTRVLNELVPPSTRGAKKDPFDTGATGGGVEWRTYAYEKVKFSFLSSFRPDPDSWKTRKEFVFTIEPGSVPVQPKRKPSAPSNNDFSSPQVAVELVTIEWNGRQCVDPSPNPHKK